MRWLKADGHADTNHSVTMDVTENISISALLSPSISSPSLPLSLWFQGSCWSLDLCPRQGAWGRVAVIEDRRARDAFWCFSYVMTDNDSLLISCNSSVWRQESYCFARILNYWENSSGDHWHTLCTLSRESVCIALRFFCSQPIRIGYACVLH